jgi:UDP-N-acetylglucosamine 2-epimerase (non-hydrolysing)
MRTRILTVLGTRPEAIKMAPVVKALSVVPEIESRVCVTGQHRQMLDQVLDVFDIVPDYDLSLMREGQDLVHVTSAVLKGVSETIRQFCPHRLLVHGDTTTAMAATLAAFYERIAVGHVEAGLRTGNLAHPFPEEMNRSFVDMLADQLYAPTETARHNLLRAGSISSRIWVTGNTVIDALFMAVKRIQQDPKLAERLQRQFQYIDFSRRLLLVTGHRRENFGPAFENICHAIADLAHREDVVVVYPVHLNPNVQEPVRRILSNNANVHLIDPLDYPPFVYLMTRADVLLTDSGGLQEEGPSLSKPVFVMREFTERPEALETGNVRLVGTDRKRIFMEVSRVLDDPAVYAAMTRGQHPYGDGHAAARIVNAVLGRT